MVLAERIPVSLNLACAKAYEELGKPERVLGVHYGSSWPPSDEIVEKAMELFEVNTIDELITEVPSFRWLPRIFIPWLQAQAPGSLIEIDNSFDTERDPLRWGHLFDRSLNGANPKEAMPEGSNYWVVGTRNASEQELSTYSSMSMSASVQPIIHLWKSEVLAICADLGMPEVALQKSCEPDCNCGRFNLPAQHIREIDLILMAQKGDLDPSYLEKNIEPILLRNLCNFVVQQKLEAGFKKEIPYIPPEDMVM
ncbi:MAG: hypothetical protein ACT4OY_08200 [Alphaproteobacteria bacterium]